MSESKLRCSGQADDGCTRCRTISVTCTYSASGGPDGKPRKRGAARKNAERSGTTAIHSRPTSISRYKSNISRTQKSGPRSKLSTDNERDNTSGFEEDFFLSDQMLQDFLLPQYVSPCADNCISSPNFTLPTDDDLHTLYPIVSGIETAICTPDHDMCRAIASDFRSKLNQCSVS